MPLASCEICSDTMSRLLRENFRSKCEMSILTLNKSVHEAIPTLEWTGDRDERSLNINSDALKRYLHLFRLW